ncbi:hypothetical protein [Streptomyces sp. NPDC059631]|uniref:hypothetical protein n=1 Tax=unclassified Streptomyces TaxID=2593676 RepID=UPI0036C08572
MSPTPKSARQFHRKNRGGDQTWNGSQYRITGSWDSRPDRPAVRTTPDKAEARRIANEYATQGAVVVVERARGFLWRPWYELDGPALLAQQHAEQQLADEGHPATPANYRPDEPDRHRTWLDWMRAEAEADRLAAEAATHARELMTQPPHVRERTVRHVTGAQR